MNPGSPLYKTREDAIAHGSKKYLRDKPCIKCGERMFLIRKKHDVCNSCLLRSASKRNNTDYYIMGGCNERN